MVITMDDFALKNQISSLYAQREWNTLRELLGNEKNTKALASLNEWEIKNSGDSLSWIRVKIEEAKSSINILLEKLKNPSSISFEEFIRCYKETLFRIRKLPGQNHLKDQEDHHLFDWKDDELDEIKIEFLGNAEKHYKFFDYLKNEFYKNNFEFIRSTSEMEFTEWKREMGKFLAFSDVRQILAAFEDNLNLQTFHTFLKNIPSILEAEKKIAAIQSQKSEILSLRQKIENAKSSWRELLDIRKSTSEAQDLANQKKLHSLLEKTEGFKEFIEATEILRFIQDRLSKIQQLNLSLDKKDFPSVLQIHQGLQEESPGYKIIRCDEIVHVKQIFSLVTDLNIEISRKNPDESSILRMYEVIVKTDYTIPDLLLERIALAKNRMQIYEDLKEKISPRKNQDENDRAFMETISNSEKHLINWDSPIIQEFKTGYLQAKERIELTEKQNNLYNFFL